jgi:hypothetical protein
MSAKIGLQELAQFTYQELKRNGIEVTLSGGACVSIYTQNAYQSSDLDFIRNIRDRFETVSEIMEEIGFRREGRHFIHPGSEFTVEFPPPPLTVGNEPPRQVIEHELITPRGNAPVRMLSPTDCVKDRLCAYFYWNDLQSLEQAVMVSSRIKVDMKELERWAAQERMTERFLEFKASLKKKKQEAE